MFHWCLQVKEYPAISGIPKTKNGSGRRRYPKERRLINIFCNHFPEKIVPRYQVRWGVWVHNNKGGIFTLNLLRAVAGITSDMGYTPIQIEDVVARASVWWGLRIVSNLEIVYSNGLLTVPFALTIKRKYHLLPMPANRNVSRKRIHRKTTVDPGKLILGVLAVWGTCKYRRLRRLLFEQWKRYIPIKQKQFIATNVKHTTVPEQE